MSAGDSNRVSGGGRPDARPGLPLGVVVGLAAEGRIARRLGRVAVGGGLPAGAAVAAERLVAAGVSGLLSFGLAGGLDPALRPGDLVIPEAVLLDGIVWSTDAALRRRFGAATAGALLAGTQIVADASAKRALFEATGAVAIDLESGAVAQVARRHGLPFAVLRAVCDPAERNLPPAALAALNAAGAIGLSRVLAAVARRPGQIGELLRLAGDARLARRGLIKACSDRR